MLSKQLEERIKKLAKKYESDKVQYVKVGISDPEVATYASYIEYGWVQRVTPKQAKYLQYAGAGDIKAGATLINPPRPIFGATFSAEKNKWAKLVAKSLPKTDVLTTLKRLGLQAQNDLVMTIANGGTSKEQFAPRADMTMALYKKAAEGHRTNGTKGNFKERKPLVYSGALLNSIGYEIE